jgi:hypothetical protein
MNPAIVESFRRKTWAVVGAHEDPARFGYKIFRVLSDAGYTVYPIHPRLAEIDSCTVYRNLSSLPSVPDVVDMVVNAETGIKVFKEIADLGIKTVWMQPGTRSDEIRGFAAAHGITLIEDCVLIRIGGHRAP